MANTVFKLRRSSVAGKVPNTSTVAIGELAINLTDKKLFSSDGSLVFEIGANLTDLQVSNNITTSNINVTDTALFQNVAVFHDVAIFGAISANSSNGAAGLVLTSNGSGVYWAPAGGSATGPVRQQFTGDGNTTTFAISGGYESNTVSVFLNGVMLHNGLEANVQSGVNVVISPAPANGALIDVVGYSVITSTSYLTIGNTSISGNVISIGNSSVNTQIVPGNVYLNGSTLVIGNTSSNITIDSTTISIAGATINTSSFSGTANNTLYVGSVASNDVVSNTSLQANLTVIRSDIANSYSNSVNYTSFAIGTANLAMVANADAAYSNATSYTDSKIATANSAIVANASAAYSNSVSYTDTKIATANLAIANAYSNAVSYTDAQIGIANSSITSNASAAYSNAVSYTDTKIATANLAIANAYSNAVSYTDSKIATANSEMAANVSAAYSNAVSYTDSKIATANSAIVANAGAAYSNATSYTDSKISTANSAIVANASGAYSNSVTYTDTKIGIANSAMVANAAAAYSNSVTYTDTKIGTANTAMIANASAAYTNATVFASNASNVNTGTLAEARLPYRMNQNVRNTDTVQFNGMTLTGNLVVSGNVNIIGANNLSLVDNMIYLNANSTVTNPDLGIAGNYNSGGYAHTGIFRDASDGIWKVFDNYAPEPDANVWIDTTNTSFHIANFQANTLFLGNTTSNWFVANNSGAYASRFYDINNLSYYLDPDGTSVVKALSVNDTFIQTGGYGYLGAFNSGSGGTYPSFNNYGFAVATNFSNGLAEVDLWNTYNPSTYTSTGIRFIQQLSASTYRDLMFLKHDGNVGIGTTSPSYKLDVAGAARVGTTANHTLRFGEYGTLLSSDTHLSHNIYYNSGWAVVSNTVPSSSIKLGSTTTNDILFLYANTGSTSLSGPFYFNSAGVGYTNGSWRGPVFYDADNTSFYADLTSTSDSIISAGNIRLGSRLLFNTCDAYTGSSYALLGLSWGGAAGTYKNFAVYDYPNTRSMFEIAGETRNITTYGNISTPQQLKVTAQYGTELGSTEVGFMWHTSGPVLTYAGNNNYIIKSNGADRFVVYTGNYSLAHGSMRSPIFYDSDNTAYYVDPASISILATIEAGGLGRSSSHCIGSNLSGAIAWNNSQLEIRNSNAGNVGIAFHRAGYSSVALYHGAGSELRCSGNLFGDTDVRSPIFYDLNNTAYYVNPNDVSFVYEHRTRWRQLIGYQSYDGCIFDGDADHRPGIAIKGRYPKIDIMSSGINNTNHGPALRLAAYDTADATSGNFKQWIIGTMGTDAVSLGFGYSAGTDPNPHVAYSRNYGNVMWFQNDYNVYIAGSIRTPILYDRNDTGYYVDPNSTSVLYNAEIIHWRAKLDRSWGGYPSITVYNTTDQGGQGEFRIHGYPGSNGGDYSINLRVDGSYYGYLSYVEAMYDINDTGYYVNPNGYSSFSTLRCHGNDMFLRGGAPTFRFEDTDQQCATLHNNSNLLYILRHNNLNEGWSTVGSGWWPMTVNLTNNNVDWGGNITAAYNIIAYASDRRLKENIKEIPNAIEKIKAIRGVTFDWNDISEENGFVPERKYDDIGCIAQEVEAVLPHVVTLAPFDRWKPDPGKDYTDEELDEKMDTSRSGENYLTIQYERMVPLLIQAIKEQQEMIETMKQEMSDLKKLINS